MTRTQFIASRFHHASPDVIALNPDIAPSVALDVVPSRKVRAPNKTEQRFLDILAAKQRRGEIAWYSYESLSLKWGDTMWYSPDVVVIYPDKPKWQLIEIKGAHIRSRDMVRFKGAASEWGERFDFAMFQWKQGAWTRLR